MIEPHRKYRAVASVVRIWVYSWICCVVEHRRHYFSTMIRLERHIVSENEKIDVLAFDRLSQRMKSGHPRNMSGPKISPENKRRGYEGGGGSRMHTNGDVHDEIERSNVEIGRRNKQGLRGSDSPGTRGQDAMDVADNSHMQGDSAGQGAVRRGWH